MSQDEEIDISDSSSEIHPNIDEKSYKNWKRQMKEQEKTRNKQRLEELNMKENLSEKEIQERDHLIKILEPMYIAKEDDAFRCSSEVLDTEDYSDELLRLVNKPTLDTFIEILNEKILNLERFEELVLYNLSESIKEGDDELGFVLSKISIFIGYIKNNGKMINKLRDELQIPGKNEVFEKDVMIYYKQSKEAILKLRNK